MIDANSMLDESKFRIPSRVLLYIVVAQLAVVLAITLVMIPLGWGWQMFRQEFLIGLLYANCIGWPQFLLSPRVWFVYAARLRPLARITVTIISHCSMVYVGTLLALAVLAGSGWFPWSQYWVRFWARFQVTTVIILVCGIVGGVVWWMYLSLKYKSQFETTQARLSSLESRLHPHFLFNTLNSISALIPDNPEAAERMTERLAALLRFALDSTHRSTVRLEHELKVTMDYLEIEKTRFGSRLQYSVDVPPDLMQAEVPPFSLQTLVENSVKHGGNEIRVSARNGNSRLVLNVWDSGPGFPEGKAISPGHGLHNLRERLSALWGSNTSVEFLGERSGTSVRISLPARSHE